MHEMRRHHIHLRYTLDAQYVRGVQKEERSSLRNLRALAPIVVVSTSTGGD